MIILNELPGNKLIKPDSTRINQQYNKNNNNKEINFYNIFRVE